MDVVDQVGSKQMKPIREIESKPFDRIEFTQTAQIQLELEYREIESNLSDDFKCRALRMRRRTILSKSPPVPVPQLPQLSPTQASNGTDGGDVVIVSGNTFNAYNSNGVGILGSLNEFSDEGHKPKKGKLFWPKLFRCTRQNYDQE